MTVSLGNNAELWGPKQEGDEIRGLLEAGRQFGLHAGGAKAYSTVAIESAWVSSPVPAVYGGDDLRTYREWLPADGFEANALSRRQ